MYTVMCTSSRALAMPPWRDQFLLNDFYDKQPDNYHGGYRTVGAPLYGLLLLFQ